MKNSFVTYKQLDKILNKRLKQQGQEITKTILEAMNFGFSEARKEREAGFAQVRQELRQEYQTGFAQAQREREAGFTQVRQEYQTGFAQAQREREVEFAHASEERSKIITMIEGLAGRMTIFSDEFTILKAEIEKIKEVFRKKFNIEISLQKDN